MKEFLQLIKNRITKLIQRVRGNLSIEIRNKVITIITIDVYSRDVIKSFVDQKIVEQSHFKWTSKLKFGIEKKNPKDEQKLVAATICDWKTWYNYEYIGNTGRLVITPLTDRCYITLT
jgi:dynein heavy chain